MTEPQITAFDSHAMLFAAAHAFCLGALENALKDNGQATFLGAGGSTPAPLYNLLSAAPIAWQAVSIGLTDERWVPHSHPASNSTMLGNTLLQNEAAKAHFTSMVPNTETLVETPTQADLAEIENAYARLSIAPDLVVLGMGPDAHTLSWFPGAQGLSDALNPETSVSVASIKAQQTETTGDITSRITLTYPILTRAKYILLLITGEEKRRTLEGAGIDTPVQHMMRAAGDRLAIYWAP